MKMDAAAEHQPDSRTYLAAERTFLAWIRTGVACMGFGFVVARFGIFLQELRLFRNASSVRSSGLSLWLGTALIAVGVLMNAISAWHHARLVGQLNRGETPPSRPSTQAVTLALFLAVIGLGMAIYLISLQYAHSSMQSNSDNKVEHIYDAYDKQRNDQQTLRSLGRRNRREAQEHSAGQGSHALCIDRSQWRGGESGHEDEARQADDLRQPQGGYSLDAGGAEHCD